MTGVQTCALPIWSIQLHKIKGELSVVFAQLHALPSGEIDNIDHREYVDIEYHTDVPPPPNLRQQFEEALPKDRYRLVRISRQYLSTEKNGDTPSTIHLEPPTPEKLFQQLWEKNGYASDDAVFKDFLNLLQEAEKSLENEPEA